MRNVGDRVLSRIAPTTEEKIATLELKKKQLELAALEKITGHQSDSDSSQLPKLTSVPVLTAIAAGAAMKSLSEDIDPLFKMDLDIRKSGLPFVAKGKNAAQQMKNITPKNASLIEIVVGKNFEGASKLGKMSAVKLLTRGR